RHGDRRREDGQRQPDRQRWAARTRHRQSRVIDTGCPSNAGLHRGGADAYGNPVSIGTPTWSVTSGTPGAISPTTGASTTFKASDSSTGTGSVKAVVSGISGTAAVTVIPATPTNLTATVKNSKVNLAWHASAGAQTYSVYRGTTTSNAVLIKSGLTPTSFSDAPGSGTYDYYVVAVGSTGLPSAASNTISASVQ